MLVLWNSETLEIEILHVVLFRAYFGPAKQAVCFTVLKRVEIVIVYKSVAVETKMYSKFNEANVIV